MIKKLYAAWAQYRLIVRRLSYGGLFLIGLLIVGPAVREPLLWEAIHLAESNAWLRLLFDPMDLVLDPLLVAAFPLLTVWGIAFAAYWRNPNRIEDINGALHFTRFLTSGVPTVLFNFVAVLLGVSVFAAYAASSVADGAKIAVYAIFYWLPATFFRHLQLSFVQSKLLGQCSKYFAAVFLTLAGLLGVYVGLSKTLQILNSWLQGRISV